MLADATEQATTYAAILADARIAALRALADILASSDDPTEKRLAATAILRLPEPEDSQSAIRRPQSPSSAPPNNESPRQSAPTLPPPSQSPTPAPLFAPNTDPESRRRAAAHIRNALTRAGIPVAPGQDPYERLGALPAPAALKIIRSAHQAAASAPG
jgi:hypothetical protein